MHTYCMSTVSRGCSVCQQWNMDDLSLALVKIMLAGMGKLLEDWECDGNAGNLPKLIFSVKIRL